ncbi:MAG TPA: MOSC domain-containing protein [Methylomirabilota bacterium]|jgi:MOSC domain-containing protein YiiM
MNVVGRIVQISVSPGGVPKRPVDSARVTTDGVEGDAHRDLEHHGGLDRAVCLYSMDAIRALVAEGHTVAPGTLGENVTLENLPWSRVGPGARVLLGDAVLLEVTRYTSPCFNIKTAFVGGEFARVSQKRHPGWSRVYTRVLHEGTIRAGDPARLVPA